MIVNSSNIDVSIIIVNYNTERLICNCINSIKKNLNDCIYEIIIVDNASLDCSGKKLEDKYKKEKNIIVIHLNENIGFGKANNVGFNISKGRNILFLNPDTILINNAPLLMSKYLDENSDIGAVGGNLYDEKMQPTHSFHRLFPSLFSELSASCFYLPELCVFGKNLRFNYKNKPLDVAFVTGADLMIKRVVLEEIGTFNPLFFMYYEETELCWRIKKKGYRVVSYPFAKIQHLEGKSSSNFKLKARFVSESRRTFFKIIYPSYYSYIVNLFFGVTCIEHMIWDIITKNQGWVYWQNMFYLTFFKK